MGVCMIRTFILAAAIAGAAAAPALADGMEPAKKRYVRPHKAKPMKAPARQRPRPAPPPVADAPPSTPGACYARLLTPPRVETYSEQVVIDPGRTEKREIPPVYEPRQREIVVQEERRAVVEEPPVYETVTEQVLVRPGGKERVVEPAQYGVARETVVVAPAQRVWKLVHSPYHPQPVWCWVDEPARTAVVERTVVVKPEIERVIATPPEYKTVHRQVLRRPAERREIVHPRKVKTITVDEVVTPGRVEVKVVEPRYGSVTKTKLVQTGERAWTPVLCESSATPARIRALQDALRRNGVYDGPSDGKYGPATADAVKRFQLRRNLPHEGYLSLDTLEALGLGRA